MFFIKLVFFLFIPISMKYFVYGADTSCTFIAFIAKVEESHGLYDLKLKKEIV